MDAGSNLVFEPAGTIEYSQNLKNKIMASS